MVRQVRLRNIFLSLLAGASVAVAVLYLWNAGKQGQGNSVILSPSDPFIDLPKHTHNERLTKILKSWEKTAERNLEENEEDNKEGEADDDLEEDKRWQIKGVDKFEKRHNGRELKEKMYGKNKIRKDKYLIYLCDKEVRCSGFSDRQRAIVGMYLMSLVTNRTFGLIMTEPARLTDFYEPYQVKWDIKKSELAGMSYIDMRCVKKTSKNCSFDDLNAKYPYDVIYLRSKNDFFNSLKNSESYRKSLPEWALGNFVNTFGHSWTTLMKPTELLRQGVNGKLLEIAIGMEKDMQVVPELQKGSCRAVCDKIIRNGKPSRASIDECLKNIDSSSQYMEKDGKSFLKNVCPVKKALKPASIDKIKTSKNYDYNELELVCVQIRLGNTSSISREPQLNRPEDVYLIWNFIRPYITNGHHVYLASDSEKVRIQAKELFGSRVHESHDPIVHVNKVQKTQDAWLGMETALMEQFLLATSCKVFIFSNTGYGERAANIRHFLTGDKDGFLTFRFGDGRLQPIHFDYKPKMLSSP